jgi:hypothetical protein
MSYEVNRHLLCRAVVMHKALTRVSGAWGSCYAIGGCGDGRRERLVWCSEMDGRTVLEVMCDPQSEPPTSKSCFTACRHHRGKWLSRDGTVEINVCTLV